MITGGGSGTGGVSQGLVVSAIGDSLTQHHYGDVIGQPTYLYGQGWLYWAMLASKGRIRAQSIWATGGLTSAQVLATDLPPLLVAKQKPDAVCVLTGMVDLINNSGVPTTNFTSAFAATTNIVQAIKAAGMQAIMCTLPAAPNYGASPYMITRWNSWVRRAASVLHCPLLDFQSVIADPANQCQYKAGYSEGDQIHPSTLGAQIMGTYIANSLVAEGGGSGGSITLPYVDTDNDSGLWLPPVNWLSTPLMDAGSLGIPTGWSGGVQNATLALIAGDANIIGQYWHIQQSATAATSTWQQGPFAQGVTAGQIVQLSGYIKINSLTPATGAPSVQLRVLTNLNSTLNDLNGLPSCAFWIDPGPNNGGSGPGAPEAFAGPFSFEGVVPNDGSNNLKILVTVVGSTVDVQLAQLSLSVFNANGTI